MERSAVEHSAVEHSAVERDVVDHATEVRGEVRVFGPSAIEDYHAHLIRLDRSSRFPGLDDRGIDTHCLGLVASGAIFAGVYVNGTLRAGAQLVPDRCARVAQARHHGGEWLCREGARTRADGLRGRGGPPPPSARGDGPVAGRNRFYRPVRPADRGRRIARFSVSGGAAPSLHSAACENGRWNRTRPPWYATCRIVRRDRARPACRPYGRA